MNEHYFVGFVKAAEKKGLSVGQAWDLLKTARNGMGGMSDGFTDLSKASPSIAPNAMAPQQNAASNNDYNFQPLPTQSTEQMGDNYLAQKRQAAAFSPQALMAKSTAMKAAPAPDQSQIMTSPVSGDKTITNQYGTGTLQGPADFNTQPTPSMRLAQSQPQPAFNTGVSLVNN